MKETTEKSKGNSYLPFLAIVAVVAIVAIVIASSFRNIKTDIIKRVYLAIRFGKIAYLDDWLVVIHE